MKNEDNNDHNSKRDEGNIWGGIGIGFLIYLIPSGLTFIGLFPLAFIAPILHVIAIIYFL